MQQTLTLKDNTEVVIREALVADAEAILAFAKMLFTTTDSVLTIAEEFNITLEEERGFIQAHTTTPTAILLIAVHNDQVISMLNFNCHSKVKMKHTGEFGVSVHPNYRGQGIGRQIIQMLIDWAQGVPQIEKLILHVMNTNTGAIKLYESLGFAVEGSELKVIKQLDGSYADLVAMGLFLER
jgi:RimJ/RimL family protein N-acetyltransferase